MGIAFGGTPGGLRIDMYDIDADGQSIKSVVHMPLGMEKRFRGLRMNNGSLYASTDEGEIWQITAE